MKTATVELGDLQHALDLLEGADPCNDPRCTLPAHRVIARLRDAARQGDLT